MTHLTLADLGWSAHFRSQLAADEIDTLTPARVSAVHRDRVDILMPDAPSGRHIENHKHLTDITVGDWVLLDADDRIHRILNRQTTLARRAAGTDAHRQLIAANVGTLAIVSSCNADFNAARLERYLVLAGSAGCLPLVLLTKADQSDDPAGFRKRAEALSPLVTALTIDARDPDDLMRLTPWCGNGETLALVGSSGVGKTTIQNGLTGRQDHTQDIREDDAKGRHTTTSRALVRTTAGGWIIDTPGMRALRITDASDGIEAVFLDIEHLATECRFNDCAHDTEPGCAVQAAISVGDIDPARLARWRKLNREDARNSETLAEARARDKALGKMYRSVVDARRQVRGD